MIRFIQGRIRRLLPPILLLLLIISPLQMYYHYQFFSGNPSLGFIDYYRQIYLGIGGMPSGFRSSIGFPELNFGHGWYIEQLLVLSLAYGVLTKGMMKAMTGLRLTPKYYLSAPKTISFPFMFMLAFVLSVLNLFVRSYFPIDTWIGLFGFIQAEPAHLPEYLMFFLTGIVLSKNNVFVTMSDSVRKIALSIGLVMVAGVYIRHLLPSSYQDALFDVWWSYEAFLAVFLTFGLIGFAHKHLSDISQPINALLASLAPLAFTAYIIHYPVVLTLQQMTDHLGFGNITVKFIVVSCLSTIATFILAKLWHSILSSTIQIAA